MSSPIETYATIYNIQVANSEVTLVEHPIESSPRTPTPKPVVTPITHPVNCPPLAITTNSEPKEGEIITRIRHHSYPLSPQSLLNVPPRTPRA